MDKLTGQVAIITGGGVGIGFAIAEVLAEADIAGIVLADVENAESAAADISERFATDAVGITTDVADSTQVEAMVEETIRKFQRVDILVNNAGIAPTVTWDEVTEANWRHVLDVNLNGAFLCTLAVLPAMARSAASSEASARTPPTAYRKPVSSP